MSTQTFDPSEYEETVRLVNEGIGTIKNSLLPAVPTVLNWMPSLAGLINSAVLNAAMAVLRDFGAWVQDLLVWLVEIIAGILAPVMFLGWAGNWRGFIKEAATDAVGMMNGLPIGKGADPLWQGAGADSYRAKVEPQVNAATQVGAMCDSTGKLMESLGWAGIGLYLAILSTIVAISETLATLIAEAISVAGIPAMVPTSVTNAAKLAALLALGTAAVTQFGTMTTAIRDLNAAVQDN
ncbi:MAG: hypothetical protein L0G99_11180, partial [Propionibacteriales bacterium]|nr:hypothetical protein [Propionibacteriales bacterium]